MVFRTFLGKFYFTVGLICLIYATLLGLQRYRPNKLSFNNPSFSSTIIHSDSTSTQLIINNISLNLPITSLPLVDNEWPVITNGLVHLANTPKPGDLGNSIIYGHNWPNLLGPLHKVKPGDTIKIKLENHQEHNFIIKFVTVVTPNQTHILTSTSDTRLTLYTCTGFLDSKRLVITALKI